MTVKNRLLFLSKTLFLMFIFAVLSIFVHFDFFRNFDFQSMLNSQKLSNTMVDYVFSAFTLMGSTEIVFILIIIIFSFFYFSQKKLRFAVYLYILIYPLELLGKLLIYHPKPPITLNRYVFDFHLPSSYIIETSYSFPSGHMARSAFLAALLFVLLSKSGIKNKNKIMFSVIIVFYILLMFLSRIYLGEHWFSDVLGGTLLGLAVANLTLALW